MPRKRAIDCIFPWGSDTESDADASPSPPKSLARAGCCKVARHTKETSVLSGISYDLIFAGPQQAGKVLAHCQACVRALQAKTGGESLAIYKIGITHNCESRFELYQSNGFSTMIVMCSSNELGFIEMLEAALISHHKERLQCRNVLPGGEGMRDKCLNAKFEAPYYCYCVAARADLPIWVRS